MTNNADKTRDAYLHDPTVTNEEYGRLIEEADEQDRRDAAYAEWFDSLEPEQQQRELDLIFRHSTRDDA